jgi:hypothetical protein
VMSLTKNRPASWAVFALGSQGNSGRGERIRTSGLYVPNVALYQAKLHPECSLWYGLFPFQDCLAVE